MVPDKIDTRVTDLITALINMDRLKIREILNPEDGTVIKEQTIDTIIVPALDEIGPSHRYTWPESSSKR